MKLALFRILCVFVMCGYHENSAKILHNYQRCWLIWSSSSLLRVFILYSTPHQLVWAHVLEPTDQPRVLGLNLWLSASKSYSWLDQRPSSFFFSPGLACSRRHSSVGYSHQTRQRSPSRNSDASQKYRSHPRTQKPTHIHPYIHTHTDIYIYIYIYIYTHTHECALSCHT